MGESNQSGHIGSVSATRAHRDPGYSVAISDWIQAISEAGSVNRKREIGDVRMPLDFPYEYLVQSDLATD
jgi:hypothetical protein